MAKSRTVILTILLSLTASQSAWPKNETSQHFKPSSKWVADYQLETCRLMRQFGEGDNAVILLMTRLSPGESFDLVVAGKPIKSFSSRPDLQIQFGPNEAVQKRTFSDGTLQKLPAILLNGAMGVAPYNPDLPANENAPSVDEERLAAIRTLTISRGGGKKIVLEVGDLKKPFVAFGACVDDLVKSWGIDVEQNKHLMRRPVAKNEPGKWLSSSDYPEEMLVKRQPALVNFRLMIDDKGNISSCHIQRSTYRKEFDDAVCNAVRKRAKFDPALDADGNPVSSYWLNSVRFQMW